MNDEMPRWQARARAVTIARDEWGIAHVHGKTDADTVFGMIYAQAEDDFNRIETNYLTALGRLAEAEGESAIYKDLRVRLFVDYGDLKARHAASPAWLRELMDAWADGLNYYLRVHPKVSPRVIKRFEPWMALSFAEGGVIGDIARVPTDDLEAFYGNDASTQIETRGAAKLPVPESLGSNAFAIAPTHALNGRALLLINPHPEFYFRSEMHVQSEEGLNCYGAVTWGQFFIFQGFNDRLGWGHTSSGANVTDEYAETLIQRDGRLFYRHGDSERVVSASKIDVPYRTAAGSLASCNFTVYRTHHGPVIRQADGRWITIAMMYKPVEALTQSFLRMKARNYQEFLQTAQLKANSGANAVYADADGNIAFLYPQFVPRRDDRFDFTRTVDGADPATDWQGEHDLDELPQVLNPSNGWIVNTNNAPYFVAGSCSPNPRDYPRYLDTAGQNPRGVNAMRVLSDRKDFTVRSLIAAAYDPYLNAFAQLIPNLVQAYGQLRTPDALKEKLAGQIAVLRDWNYCYSLDSIATSLAISWVGQVMKDIEPSARARNIEIGEMFDYMNKGRLSATLNYRALNFINEYIIHEASTALKLNALSIASDRLTQDFGSWRTPWGEINRFQRLSGDTAQKFDDHLPSMPVALTSSIWGALASFKSSRQEHTRRYYGTSGNGFVAAVEFGERVHAQAIVAGGASSDPKSPHFNDQAARFTTGDLREVYFYPDQVQAHAERTYHPGE